MGRIDAIDILLTIIKFALRLAVDLIDTACYNADDIFRLKRSTMKRKKKIDEYDEIYSNSTNSEEDKDDEYEDNAEASRDWLGYDVPNCPKCGSIMKYHFRAQKFKCFSCGYSVYEDDLEDELDSHASFNDIYQDGSNVPRCEECGTVMEYSGERSKFRCPHCGSTMDEADWELANEYDDYEEYYGSQEDEDQD